MTDAVDYEPRPCLYQVFLTAQLSGVPPVLATGQAAADAKDAHWQLMKALCKSVTARLARASLHNNAYLSDSNRKTALIGGNVYYRTV